MIYLLHFDPPVGKSKHYLGYCADDRLAERMREHALGSGATLTAEAVKRGCSIYLARTYPGGSRSLERLMKNGPALKRSCPLCCPMFASLKQQVYQLDTTRPDQPPPRAVLDWRPAGSTALAHTKRKGDRT